MQNEDAEREFLILRDLRALRGEFFLTTEAQRDRGRIDV